MLRVRRRVHSASTTVVVVAAAIAAVAMASSMLFGSAEARSLTTTWFNVGDSNAEPVATTTAFYASIDGSCDESTAATAATATSKVIVMWHGMGDVGSEDGSMGTLARAAREATGACVRSLMFGSGSSGSDRLSGYIGNVNAQVDAACVLLRNDALIRRVGGFHAVGFSQGGQFIRAVVQRCGVELGAKTLITLGAQHMGVDSLPGCGSNAPTMACRAMNRVASDASASFWLRKHVVQAQYFRQTKDHSSYQRYLETNVFLPEINNEGQANDNPVYRKALSSLERFVMFRFENDDMVYPSESSWFGSRVIGGANRSIIVPYDHNEVIYSSLGLDALDANGRIETHLIPGARHMQFTLEWFKQTMNQYVV